MSKDNESLGSDALFPAGTKRYANSPGIPADSKVKVGGPSPTDVASNAPNVLTPDASKTSATDKQKLIERIVKLAPTLLVATDKEVDAIAQAWLEDVEKAEYRGRHAEVVKALFLLESLSDDYDVKPWLRERLAALKETQTNE